MPSKTSKKKPAAALPKIPKELIDQFVSGPMSAEAVNAASMAFKKALIERALDAELHTMIAGIAGDNLGSMRLHEKLGFTRVAQLAQVGRKFDRWVDVVIMQRALAVQP